jgi:RimJ/RimL family protein N-acetyltransferase
MPDGDVADRVVLRELTRDDLPLVLAWRSNPLVYEHFREQDGPLSWEEHQSWFESRSTDRRDAVIEYDGRPVGVVSIDESRAVSIYLGEVSARGQGIASAALEAVVDDADDILSAEVHAHNEPSQRLFERCGFSLAECDGDWKQYEYDPAYATR